MPAMLLGANKALAGKRNWKAAAFLLASLPQLELQADEISYGAAIANSKDRSDAFSYSTLLTMPPWSLALEWLHGMRPLALPPDVFCFSSSLTSLKRDSHWRSATQVLQSMTQQQIEGNSVTSDITTSLCGWQRALSNFNFNSRSLPSIILAFTGAWSQCLHFWSFQQTLFTSSALMTQLQRQMRWEMALIHLEGGNFEDHRASHATIMALKEAGRWLDALSLFGSMERRRLRLDSFSYAAAQPEGQRWKVQFSLLQDMRDSLHILSDMLLSAQDVDAACFNAVISSCEASGDWQIALALLHQMIAISLRQDAYSYSAVMNTVSVDQWPLALHFFNKLNSHGIKRTVIVFNTALNAVLHAAFKEATQLSSLSILKPMELAQLWRYLAMLGIQPSSIFQERLRVETERKLGDFTLEQLVLVAWGTSAFQSLEAQQILDLTQRRRLDRRRERTDSTFWRQNLLGILHACSFSGSLSRRCIHAVDLVLRSWGRSLDVNGTQEMGPLEGLQTSDTNVPTVVMDFKDRMVMLKPVDWEVQDDNMEQQMVSFLQQNGLAAPILQDKSFGQGFLHRLDVPSSGLLLLAKTYEAHCDLSVQLAAGFLERDYSVLVHGWAINRNITAQLYWRQAPKTKADGHGKPSFTEVQVLQHFTTTSGTVSLLGIRIFTGRQHQIRAHCAHVGHPSLTDGKYSSSATYAADKQFSSHNALHRQRLAFRDLHGQSHEVTIPMKNYMGCAALRSCERKGKEIWITCPDGYETDCEAGCVPLRTQCREEEVDLISWLRRHGGFIDARLQIGDGPLGRGLFAKEDIAATDLLLSIPLELIMTDKSSPCAAIKQLRNELQRGECSFYWPYLKTLHGVEPFVPDMWSFEERSLLDGLPTPQGGWQSYTQRYFADCLDVNADALTLQALMLYHTRAGPFGMSPIYDLMNHGYNVTFHGFDAEEGEKGTFWVRAASDIKAGGELLNSMMNGVAFRPGIAPGMHSEDFDGAPEIFRSYGFLESPPVMWWFQGLERHAWIQMDTQGSMVWFQDTEHGPGTNLEALLVDGESTLLQLEELPSGKISGKSPVTEAWSLNREMAMQYKEAFINALKAAMQAARMELNQREEL
eukprot:symbB.v1.2.010211.t1/scaffold665.1/size175136/2